jgi:heptosyltransferase-3
MLLREYTGPIVEGNPYLDDVIWYDNDRGLIPFNAICATLRKGRFDAVVVGYPTLRLAWLMYRAGIPLRIGTGYRYYSMLFNRRVYEHRKDARRHEVEYNLRLLEELDCSIPEEPEFFLDIPDDARATVKKVLEDLAIDPSQVLVIMHPGSGGSAREWPAEYFGMVAELLMTLPNVRVIVTGGRGEEPKSAKVVVATKGRAVSLVGRLTIKQLAVLLQSADVFISNSTGPLHIAVAVGTPVVGLYPQIVAMSPRRWGPYRGNNRVLVPDKSPDCTTCVKEKREHCECMMSISVARVFEETLSLLAETKGAEKGVIQDGRA